MRKATVKRKTKPKPLDPIPRRVGKRDLKPPPPIANCAAYARAALSAPPLKPWIERYPAIGTLLGSFVVNRLDLMPSGNPWGRLEGWQKAKMIKELEELIPPQLATMRHLAWPLSGRPLIRAIRFSSAEGDNDSGWTKLAIDRLTMRKTKGTKAGKTVVKGGCGLIVDDKPSLMNLKVWWEPAPPGMGFGYFEIYSGAIG